MLGVGEGVEGLSWLDWLSHWGLGRESVGEKEVEEVGCVVLMVRA